MKKVIVIIGILIVIGAGGTIGALYTQIWDPTWNPFRPAPEVVLAGMVVKMEGLKTLHSEGSFEIEGKDGEEASVRIKMTGDTDQADSKNPKSKGNFGVEFSTEGTKISTEIDFITIDQTSYWKLATVPDIPLPISGFEGLDFSIILDVVKNQWIKFDEESLKNLSEMLGQEYQPQLSEEEQKELTEKIVNLLKGKKFYEVKEELPDVKIRDKMTYHYLLTLDEEGIKELIPDIIKTTMEYYFVGGVELPSEEEIKEVIEKELPGKIDEFFEKVGEITFEVWVGQKDKYLYKVEFEKEIDLSEFLKREAYPAIPVSPGKVLISGEINFSKFNQPVEVEAPAEFKTLEEIFQSIMMQFLMMSGIPPIDEMITIPGIPQMPE